MKNFKNYILESYENSYLKLSAANKEKLIELDREYGELFFMKRNDFNEYCKFINWCIKIFNDKYGELNSSKIYSFLAEITI